MKYVLIALLFVACTSKVDSLKKEYYEKTALRDSLKKDFYKLQSKELDKDYIDTNLSKQGYRLGARIDRLNDSIAKLRDQIDIEK